jgi:adenine-specific DNA-methyltransferase
MLLGRCEFGKEDYSFNIVNLPIEQDEEIEDYGNIENEVIKTKSKTKKKDDENQSTLF